MGVTHGHSRREDLAYVRHGGPVLFMAYAPHFGWCEVIITTAMAWA